MTILVDVGAGNRDPFLKQYDIPRTSQSIHAASQSNPILELQALGIPANNRKRLLLSHSYWFRSATIREAVGKLGTIQRQP